MKNVEKIKEAIMQDLLEKFGLLIDECAAQEKRIFELEEKVAALSSQFKTEKKVHLQNIRILNLPSKCLNFLTVRYCNSKVRILILSLTMLL